MNQTKRGRPRKTQVLSGAERAKRYRLRQLVREHQQLTEILKFIQEQKP